MTKVEVLKQAQEQVNDIMEDLNEIENARKDVTLVNAHAKLFEACAWLAVSADMATMDDGAEKT